MNDNGKAMLIGAVGGAAAGFVVWQVLAGIVDRQVTSTLQEQVPPLVRTEIDRKFASLGISASMAGNVRTLMTNLDQLGVFSTLANVTTVPRR